MPMKPKTQLEIVQVFEDTLGVEVRETMLWFKPVYIKEGEKYILQNVVCFSAAEADAVQPGVIPIH